MKSLERSAKLKLEADDLLREIRLDELCRDIGALTPTGSYFLDLMIYPDIDLYSPPARSRQLFEIATHIVENHPVVSVSFLNVGLRCIAEYISIGRLSTMGCTRLRISPDI